jgi:hypothetical protein
MFLSMFLYSVRLPHIRDLNFMNTPAQTTQAHGGTTGGRHVTSSEAK